ncbi:hypothetical protein Tco_0007423 [Tanacetum coccineum]
MSTPKFAETHNLVAFLEKPKESNGFEEIIDFLNASSVQYALTVNPTIYTTCIEQFWTYAKVKTVNGERQIQALVDKKNVIISETSIKSDLKLDDAEGTNLYPLLQFLQNGKEWVSTMASAINWGKISHGPKICESLPGQTSRGNVQAQRVYVTPSHTKKVFANMKGPCKGFSGRVTPLFSTMMVQVTEDIGTDSTTPTDSHSIPIITQPSSSKPQKKKSRRKQRKDSAPTEPTTEETTHEEHVSTHSYDPPQSEKAKTAQAKEITCIKKRVKQLEKRRKSRPSRLRRLRKVGSSSRVESSNDASLGAQEDASKQRGKIEDLDADAEEIEFEKVVEDPIVCIATTKKSIPTSATEVVNTASAIKDKGKGKIVEPEVPLKKKDQFALDEEMARNLEAQLQAELIKEERLADFELAQRLQAEEQGEITIEERSRLFVELMNKRKKHFAKLRAEEIRRKPPTKTQKRNQMSTYLKNMVGYKHKVVKGSDSRTEESSKRAGDELEFDMSKKQKIDEHVEVEKDDQEEVEMKRHIEIVKDDEVAINAIPLVTKPLVIVEYQIDKDRRMGYFKLIRADGNSKRYSSMIKMLQGIDREDLETLWKLVKAKYKNTRPEDDYERVLWGDLKVIFEPDIKSDVWRNLQGYKVTV